MTWLRFWLTWFSAFILRRRSKPARPRDPSPPLAEWRTLTADEWADDRRARLASRAPKSWLYHRRRYDRD